mgnify:CR=1 FL=1
MAELKESLTFAAVKQLAMTYQVNEVLQRIIKFFASFCTLSLVNPNNLLTHTHTHTQYAHLAYNNTFFLLAYARAKRAVTPVNKGLPRVSFVRFFMPFLKTAKTQNIAIFSSIKSNLHSATEHQEEEIIHCFNNSSYAFVSLLNSVT